MGRDFNIDKAYPKVEIDKQGMGDVRCLMDSYGGAFSETTAIFQYIYQAYVCLPLEKEWHEMFEKLAVSEMHHHSLLGEALVALGGTPIIAGNQSFWNGANVNYIKNLVEIIDFDIETENKAIKDYLKVIECLDNYTIREMIERIIEDEKNHIRILREARPKAVEMLKRPRIVETK